MQLKRILILVGSLLVLSAVLAACGSKVTPTPESTLPKVDVPNLETWAGSGHADTTAEAFNHWNDVTANPDGVPTSCARCHTSTGFVDFITNGEVTAAVAAPAGVIVCTTCHNDVAQSLTSVTFPSGEVVETTAPGEAICMTCHQGRESKVSVDAQIAKFNVSDVDAIVEPMTNSDGTTSNFGFRNVHYFFAGATLYGSQSQVGYEYDGKLYDPKFQHVEGVDTCTACHDQHATAVRVTVCAECHQGVTTVEDLKNNREPSSAMDYNGNGDVTEGIYFEIKGLQDSLYATLQNYAREVIGTPIAYDEAAYPYWFVAGDDGAPALTDGKTTGYSTWSVRLLKATYNYQVSVKDPGAFAHNAKYIIELLYDSIADLNTSDALTTKTDMSSMVRDDSAHFAGNTMPFRDWDDTGIVPAPCSKCHSSAGLPSFIANGGTEVVTSGGLVYTALVGQPTASGFACSTCHDTSNFPNRIAVTKVAFPSGASLTFSTEKDADGNLIPVDANLCLECHQGRESTATVNASLTGKPLDTVDSKIRFKNVHYLAAGATLFGGDAMGAYQYDGQTYVGFNTDHPLNKCTDCHDAHSQEVKLDTCKTCHTTVSDLASLEDIRMPTDTTDWNGNGDATEGIYKEIDSFRTALHDAIYAYAAAKGTGIMYDPAGYPYWFVDADQDGVADLDANGKVTGYNAWTPRLMKAAYNLQYSIKDPGVFAHNPMYIMQVMYDSIKDLGGSTAGLTRP
jgi:hypothetical protein